MIVIILVSISCLSFTLLVTSSYSININQIKKALVYTYFIA